MDTDAYTIGMPCATKTCARKRGRKPGRLITEAQLLKFAMLFLAIVLAEGGAIVATLLYVLLSK